MMEGRVQHLHFTNVARHMVTVLPIMLQHLYGTRIWSWFTDEAKAETFGWVYNQEFGRVISPDGGYTEEMLDDPDWDDESIEEMEEEELVRLQIFRMNPKIILNEPAKANHYNNNGTVKTHATLFKQEKEKEPHKDDRSSHKSPSAVSTEDGTTKEAPKPQSLKAVGTRWRRPSRGRQ
jgi:hypothetical protein